MSNRSRIRRAALSVPAFLLLAGCAGPGQREDVLAADQARLVAEDFVSALAQLRGFSPRNTTVQLRPASTDFGEQLAGELRRAGFGMQMVPEDDSGPLLVTYDAQGYGTDAGESVGYRVRVGSVELGREYEVRSGRVFPMTALSVRGTRISESPLDDSIFDRNVASEEARRIEDAEIGSATGATSADPSAGQGGQDAPWVLLSPLDDGRSSSIPPDEGEQEAPMPDEASPGTFVGAATDSGAPPASTSPSAAASPTKRFRPPEPIDVLEAGGEAFAPLADERTIADQVVLGFGDDSTRLRRGNRAELVAMAGRFDPEREMISVLGCSNGPTGEPGRNKALAIGRADRVRVELIAQGVPADRVLDEGCWSAERIEGLPGRAAIVSVHRRTPT